MAGTIIARLILRAREIHAATAHWGMKYDYPVAVVDFFDQKDIIKIFLILLLGSLDHASNIYGLPRDIVHYLSLVMVKDGRVPIHTVSLCYWDFPKTVDCRKMLLECAITDKQSNTNIAAENGFFGSKQTKALTLLCAELDDHLKSIFRQYSVCSVNLVKKKIFIECNTEHAAKLFCDFHRGKDYGCISFSISNTDKKTVEIKNPREVGKLVSPDTFWKLCKHFPEDFKIKENPVIQKESESCLVM